MVRTYNERKYIDRVLRSVANQAYDDYEVILVDSGSTDGTVELAEPFVDRTVHLSPEKFTYGRSLNVGCRKAQGDFVVFLSGHAIPTDETWLARIVAPLREPSVAMTYTNQTGGEPTKFPEQRLFDELFPSESRRQRPPDYFANNASSAVKRDLWKNHEFDESLVAHEDIEWAKYFMDRGYEIAYEAEACVYHIHEESTDGIYDRFEREACADVALGVRSPYERWLEYARMPFDIIRDTLVAISTRRFNRETFAEIVRFRLNQRLGAATGLASDETSARLSI
ncbi:glycosyltransferase family 2 protein [Halorussus ruber]|uniref:glycosyltransferase family 2 protein n=1 Tax=Halorussus ruber TaxID=1126238 RepID=UPI00143DCD1D|nr:glycosyltransferase family A protein [Halorussus ruber]